MCCSPTRLVLRCAAFWKNEAEAVKMRLMLYFIESACEKAEFPLGSCRVAAGYPASLLKKFKAIFFHRLTRGALLRVDHVHATQYPTAHNIAGTGEKRIKAAQNQLVINIFSALVPGNDPGYT